MKLFLDDMRPTPPGWVGVKTPEEAITHLETGQVELLSLDHDLGLPEPRNGYAVVKWLEYQVATRIFRPPQMWVHSANSVGIQNMLRGIQSIYRLANIEYIFHPVWSADAPDRCPPEIM
jgi:hypothetical protein